jgi:sugar-phosphatase
MLSFLSSRPAFIFTLISLHMINTVLLDMDGLLIDSEPLWQAAGTETLQIYGVQLSAEDYHRTTGLRTAEWIDHWFTHFDLKAPQEEAVEQIVTKAIQKIAQFGEEMPGVHAILRFFTDRNFKIGLATSSPMNLVEVVVDKLRIRSYFQAIVSAEHLPYGKPHPQVYLNGAAALGARPSECVCFEDSFNGMIAAKAARMKCVVVPAAAQLSTPHWSAADLVLSSLEQFNEEKLNRL